MEAIVACTRNNAFAVGLENDVGVVGGGPPADVNNKARDPLTQITVFLSGQHHPHEDTENPFHYLAMVIKDGHIVALDGNEETEDTLAYATSAQA